MGVTDEQKAAMQKQICYYFSDSNIMGDKFLLGKVKDNAEGWVDLSVLATFNKIKQITAEVAEIAACLEGAAGLAVNEDKTKVRRTEPLPTEWNPTPRTIYVKGLPEEEELSVLHEFFGKFGKVNKVSKRSFRGKLKEGQSRWKKSAYVEFSTEAEALKAIEEITCYKDGDEKLIVMSQEAHQKEVAQYEKPKEKRSREDDEDENGTKEAKVELPEMASVRFTEVGDAGFLVVKTELEKKVSRARFCVVADGVATVMLDSKEDADTIMAANAETPFVFEGVTPKECIRLEGEQEVSFRTEMNAKVAELRAKTRTGGGGGKGGKKGGKKGRKGGKGRR
eukprot:TRINITY_DN2065_c1_g1_i1.p1 TRINITY_DN2065_c1_g1~~TRINITY_DN2065_c1_g1_i1.p1  ORF type:complete len:337 (+),score=105.66 TRINITY_DN2065_c1_g1_i1:46-1056(+)